MSVTITISDKLFKRLEELAGDYEPSPEDFDIYGCSGGNIDDAFYMGVADGEGALAADIIYSHESNKT